MADVTIGPFLVLSPTTIQRARVQTAWDRCTFPKANVGDPIRVHFRRPVDMGRSATGRGYNWGSDDDLNNISINDALNDNETAYTVLHEMAHVLSNRKLSATDKTLLKTMMVPSGANSPWKADNYFYSPSECFADEFAKVLFVSSPPPPWANVSEIYLRHFAPADYDDARDIVLAGTGGDPGPPGVDPGPDHLLFVAAGDVARRLFPADGSTQKYASGKEQHLPFGMIPVNDKNFVYDALLKFDINWPAGEVSIDTATIRLTCSATGGPDSAHISNNGSNSVLKGSVVLPGQNWTEGNNGEGVWDHTDWMDPTWAVTSVVLGSVGPQPLGHLMEFNALSLVRQWAPANLNVGSLGKGLAQPNKGLHLEAANKRGIGGAFVFASSDHPNADWRPTLFVTFTPTGKKPLALTVRPTGIIGSDQFIFEGTYTDLFSTDEVGWVQIEVNKDADGSGASVWAPGQRAATATERSTSVVRTLSSEAPAGTWKVDRQYAWRLKVWSAKSGLASDWSDWEPFLISGSAPTVTAENLGTKATLDAVFFGGPYTDTATSNPPGPTPPVGFPRMTMFTVGEQSRTFADEQAMITEFVRLHQRGVVIQGKDWGGSTTELTADIAARIDAWKAAGFKVYVGLWMAQFNTIDRTAAMAAWNAGLGKWDGAVLDCEAGWNDEVALHPVATKANAAAHIADLRAAGCTMVGLISYSVPAPGFPGWHSEYDFWNDHVDLFLPPIFFSGTNADNGTDDADRILRVARHAFRDFAWTHPMKPLIPLCNVWGAKANAPNRLYYANSCLTTGTGDMPPIGAVAWWRMKPSMNTEVRDVLHSIPRDDPGTSPDSTVIATRIQFRSEPEGNPAWDTDIGTFWDTGEVGLTTDESVSRRIKRLYGGRALLAGDYTYRVEVEDITGVWSEWSYATLTLTAPYNPDPGNGLTGYGRKRSPARIVIRDMGANRGPGNIKAVIYDASNIGASQVANDTGEFYFTIPTTHPQASEIEPMQRHYSLEHYRGGEWKTLFEGLIVDMDATEDEAVFYGLDYMGLLSKSIEKAFYDWTSDPDKQGNNIESGGSKYFDRAISWIIKDQLERGRDDNNSPMGFIEVEPKTEHSLMETIPEHVSIHAEFRERLGFILGLIQSAKAGNGKRMRLWVERHGTLQYRWRMQNNAGQTRENLRLKYGELVQGFRIIVLGDWAARVYGVGRVSNEVKLRFAIGKTPNPDGSGDPVIDTSVWGNVAIGSVWQDLIDQNDLQRRVNQMALEVGKFGKGVALGLRLAGLEPFDGWNIMDSVPIEIIRGAVDTTRYGGGLWTILGVEWRVFPDGHDEMTLTVKPKEDDTTPPDPDLIPSRPVSGASEWDRLNLVGSNLVATSTSALRSDGTLTATINASWDPITEENFGYFVIQLAHTDDGLYTNALTLSAENSEAQIDDLLPTEDYSLRIGAYDLSGNFSGWSPGVDVVAATDTTIPGVPSGMYVLAAIRALVVGWNPVGDTDLAYYEVAYRLTGATTFTIVSTHGTSLALLALQAGPIDPLVPSVVYTYDVKVRSTDLSNNHSAYTPVIVGTPALVGGDDIIAHSITSVHVATEGLDAGVIKTGDLIIGGGGANPSITVLNADDTLIGHVDNTGMIWKDPINTYRIMRFLDGVLEFSDDNGLTWRTAVGPEGVVADSILVGRMPGGQNLMPNSSFEMSSSFSTPTSHQWDTSGDWGTTIGTDVNIDKSTGTLNLSVIT